MSPTEDLPVGSPREWLRRARSDLIQARNPLPGVYLESLCFHAQQAAEKAIKAVLISRAVEFPYVHDLGGLLALLEGAGETIPEEIRAAGTLTMYAITTRYPHMDDPVTEPQYQKAVDISEAVVQWAEERL